MQELPTGLKKQQAVFSRSHEVRHATVKASYIIDEIASTSKPYSDNNFVRTCMLKAAEVVCPEKQQGFANISLTGNTEAERISELAGDVDQQLMDKV